VAKVINISDVYALQIKNMQIDHCHSEL